MIARSFSLALLLAAGCSWQLDAHGVAFECGGGDGCPDGSMCDSTGHCRLRGDDAAGDARAGDTMSGDTYVELVLLEDDFDDGSLDASKWQQGETFFNFGGGNWEISEVADTDGYARVYANVGAQANTHYQLAWIVSTADLRTGQDVEVEVTLASAAENGGFLVEITDSTGAPPASSCAMSDGCAQLLWNSGVANTLSTMAQATYTFSITAAGIATSTASAEMFQNGSWTGGPLSLDISGLSEWHLRFMVVSSSSSGYLGAENYGHVFRVRVVGR